MSLSDGYTELAPGKIANVATFLEMRAPRPISVVDAPAGASLQRLGAADVNAYRDVMRQVGAPYLWCSRLQLSGEELQSLIGNPDVEAYTVRVSGSDEGLLELDFRLPYECELRFFGVTEQLIGKGYGRWLMHEALRLAWARPIERFWLHTCNLDHPNALAFYVRAGFVPYKRKVEVSDDPRLNGLLPRDAAPHIPVI